jgi:hypothetical protein
MWKHQHCNWHWLARLWLLAPQKLSVIIIVLQLVLDQRLVLLSGLKSDRLQAGADTKCCAVRRVLCED